MIIALNDENPVFSQRRLKVHGINLYAHDLTAYILEKDDLLGPGLVVRNLDTDGLGPKKGAFIASSSRHVLLVQPTESADYAYKGPRIVPPGTLVDFEFSFNEDDPGPNVLAYVYVLEVGVPKA